MLDKMVIVIIAFFLFMTYHRHLLVCAWSSLLLSAIFVIHEAHHIFAHRPPIYPATDS